MILEYDSSKKKFETLHTPFQRKQKQITFPSNHMSNDHLSRTTTRTTKSFWISLPKKKKKKNKTMGTTFIILHMGLHISIWSCQSI
jgi:hypothetical protein